MILTDIKNTIASDEREKYENLQFSIFISKDLKEHEEIKLNLKHELPLSNPVEPYSDIKIYVNNEFGISIEVDNSPIYIYGIYKKHCRTLSQTRMFLRKYKDLKSVDGFINGIKTFFDADKVNFMGAGREDIDVQMLNGRPFLVEVTRPKQNLIFSHLKLVLNAGVQLSNLLHVTRDVKKQIFAGETGTKTYRALVYSKDPFNSCLLQEYKKQFYIEQKTPIRVLHRRSDLVRTRHMEITDWQEDGNYAVIEIISQGGAYIKEFINGDFGRTIPSLSGIFNSYCDCLYLDVVEVDIKEVPLCHIINNITFETEIL